MPRPPRIEYENAYYHVMNRGKGRQRIFHSDAYYHAFLSCLAEASERFDVIVHGYCLMSNHYHLLLQTRHANLGRVMRHINGVYTQRYNRLKHTDGPLFRGRYKAIVIEKDSYLLQLSRYIHRNPIELKQPLVKKLEQYRWSSYPAYINKDKTPHWLHRDTLYEMLGQRQKYQGYEIYVMQGNDTDIKKFYSRTNIPGAMGQSSFIEWLQDEIIPEVDDKTLVNTVLQHKLTIKEIIQYVALYYKLETKQLTTVVKGPGKGLLARKIAMYLCQQLGGYQLTDIMESFELSNRGSVSFITSQIRRNCGENRKLEKEINDIKSYIIKNAT
ncbi:MAG: transposase [Thiohalomonadales bacterium]